MSKAFGDFTRKLVPTLMNLMAEIEDDPDWLNSEQFNDDDNESMAVVWVPSRCSYGNVL